LVSLSQREVHLCALTSACFVVGCCIICANASLAGQALQCIASPGRSSTGILQCSGLGPVVNSAKHLKKCTQAESACLARLRLHSEMHHASPHYPGIVQIFHMFLYCMHIGNDCTCFFHHLQESTAVPVAQNKCLLHDPQSPSNLGALPMQPSLPSARHAVLVCPRSLSSSPRMSRASHQAIPSLRS